MTRTLKALLVSGNYLRESPHNVDNMLFGYSVMFRDYSEYKFTKHA